MFRFNSIKKWYRKKSAQIVDPTIKEFMGFFGLIIAFAAVIAGLWNNPSQINALSSHFQNIAGQYGFFIGLGTLNFIVWIFILSGTFFVTISSWLIYKLYFRTRLHKYMRKLEEQAKLSKGRKKSHHQSSKKNKSKSSAKKSGGNR